MGGFNHNVDPVETLGNDWTELFAVINCGSGSPTMALTNIPGAAPTLSAPATGTVRMVVDPAILPAGAAKCLVAVSVGNTSAADLNVVYDKQNLAALGRLDVYTRSGGSATNLAGELSVRLLFKNTSR